MARPKKSESENVEVKQPTLLTAQQAFKTIGGNPRLLTYISKKYNGVKSLDDWRSTFEKYELI